jgi:NADPH:quinone reductase-like Zn-dependent oxidoreductase
MVGAGVNQADLHVLDAPAERGSSLGLDIAGVVDEVGPRVARFEVGDRVAALCLPPRAAAEHVVVPAAAAARVPDKLDLLDAAILPTNALTAAQLLALLGRRSGRLLVTGAAGGIGGYAVPLAARSGWTVTALARAADRPFLAQAGAHQTSETLDGAHDFDAVLDTALLGAAALRAVRDDGAYVGVFPGREPQPERGVSVISAAVRPDGAELSGLRELAADGVLIPRRAGTASLAEAGDVYRQLRAGGVRDRYVLVP